MEKKTVEFLLTGEDFTYVDLNYKNVMLKGKHRIIIENLECDIDLDISFPS